jgi:hypothetical protein
MVDKKLGAFCESRIPPHARDQVKLSDTTRGNHVTLNEERAPYNGVGEWAVIPIAQFRFEPDANLWSLFCSDRNGKWHRYEAVKPMRDFESLLHVVETDQSGIIWG